jgi:hypothetical protein
VDSVVRAEEMRMSKRRVVDLQKKDWISRETVYTHELRPDWQMRLFGGIEI